MHQLLRSRERQNLLAGVFDLGIRHFDTSPFYGHGIAETDLGRFLHNRRSEVLVATKFGIKPDPLLARFPWLMYAQLGANAAQRKLTGKNRLAITPKRDYSAGEARRSLERSLRALRTDHVDIYFLHDPSLALLGPADVLLLTLERLRQEGKARYIGFAGAARDCIDVAARFPGMAQIMQIDAAGSASDFNLMQASGLPCHFSFGHFRDKVAPMNSLLREAITTNKRGVILYSSRRMTRVAQVIALLTELEG